MFPQSLVVIADPSRLKIDRSAQAVEPDATWPPPPAMTGFFGLDSLIFGRLAGGSAGRSVLRSSFLLLAATGGNET